jgi:hypothetical protein
VKQIETSTHPLPFSIYIFIYVNVLSFILLYKPQTEASKELTPIRPDVRNFDEENK